VVSVPIVPVKGYNNAAGQDRSRQQRNRQQHAHAFHDLLLSANVRQIDYAPGSRADAGSYQGTSARVVPCARSDGGAGTRTDGGAEHRGTGRGGNCENHSQQEAPLHSSLLVLALARKNQTGGAEIICTGSSDQAILVLAHQRKNQVTPIDSKPIQAQSQIVCGGTQTFCQPSHAQ
jgi:hypothetical protein